MPIFKVYSPGKGWPAQDGSGNACGAKRMPALRGSPGPSLGNTIGERGHGENEAGGGVSPVPAAEGSVNVPRWN